MGHCERGTMWIPPQHCLFFGNLTAKPTHCSFWPTRASCESASPLRPWTFLNWIVHSTPSDGWLRIGWNWMCTVCLVYSWSGHVAPRVRSDFLLNPADAPGRRKEASRRHLAGCCVQCFCASIDRQRTCSWGLSGFGVFHEGLAWISGAGVTTSGRCLNA